MQIIELLVSLATHVQHGFAQLVVQLTQLGLHFMHYYYPLDITKCREYHFYLTLYVAVTQFTIGKLRYCYVKS